MRLLLHETGGTTLVDSNGHSRDIALPARDALGRLPGRLSWTTGRTVPLDLPSTVQHIQNVEITLAGSVVASGIGPSFEMLGAYEGGDPAIALHLNNTYSVARPPPRRRRGLGQYPTRYLGMRPFRSVGQCWSIEASISGTRCRGCTVWQPFDSLAAWKPCSTSRSPSSPSSASSR